MVTSFVVREKLKVKVFDVIIYGVIIGFLLKIWPKIENYKF